MSAEPVRVAICVVTYQRSDGLRRLLRSLADVEIDSRRAAVSIVVTDNNPDRRELASATELQQIATWPVDVHHEPRRGIPYARNNAVAKATGNSDVIVFVDDDEAVTPGWLTALLDARDHYHADVVVGPVVPLLPPDAPPWVAGGGFRAHTRRANGTVMATAPTNNTMVGTAWFDRLDRWFDESMARTGGSDTELFTRMADAGARIVWADRAVVYEHVPPERATAEWVVRRSFRLGVVEGSLLARRFSPASRTVLMRTIKSVGHVAVGGLRALIGFPWGRQGLVAGLRQAAWGLGWLWGLAGGTYEEYR